MRALVFFTAFANKVLRNGYQHLLEIKGFLDKVWCVKENLTEI